jgi:hypothetical protein
MAWLGRHKYLVLPVTLIAALFLQPVIGGPVELLNYLLMLAVFLVVFEQRWERMIALALGAPAIAANVASHFCSGGCRLAMTIAFHVLVIGFLALAVAMILHDVFRNRRIRFEHLVGAFSGYVLAGILWGNLYLLIELIAPGSFKLHPQIAAPLADEGRRRFLFNHLSFQTITGASNGDITPLAPAACTLSWLETMFGQFYLAIYIGQLVGLRLARAGGTRSTRSMPTDSTP